MKYCSSALGFNVGKDAFPALRMWMLNSSVGTLPDLNPAQSCSCRHHCVFVVRVSHAYLVHCYFYSVLFVFCLFPCQMKLLLFLHWWGRPGTEHLSGMCNGVGSITSTELKKKISHIHPTPLAHLETTSDLFPFTHQPLLLLSPTVYASPFII